MTREPGVAADPLYLVVSVDTDEDAFDRAAFRASVETGWRGLDEGIPSLIEALDGFTDTDGRSLALTWFVRCDVEVARLAGDAMYVVDNYRPFWEERAAGGDEIAWHPHLFETVRDVSGANGHVDEAAVIERLEASAETLQRSWLEPTSVRIGRAHSSDAVMAWLERGGFAVDSTALPGRVRRDDAHDLDWQGTPLRPYVPSASDYRVPGDLPLDIVEVPMSMVDVRCGYDPAPVARYANVAYRNDVVGDALRDFVLHNDLLVTVLHPYEVLEGPTHPLVSFDAGHVRRNLDGIAGACLEAGRPLRTVTIGRVPDVIAPLGGRAA